MEIATNVIGGICIIAGAVAGMAFSLSHRDLGIWATWLAIVTAITVIFALIQGHYWRNDLEADMLIPGNGPTPEIDLPEHIRDRVSIPESTMFVFLGNSVAWTNTFPHTVIKQRNEDMLVIDEKDGKMGISASFFDQQGAIICQVIRNKIHLNAGNFFRVEQSPHKLIVFDKSANKALEVEFINPRAVHFLGDFYLRNGTHIVIKQEEQQLGGLCFSGSVAGANEGASFVID